MSDAITRWTPQRKAQLVERVAFGLATKADVLAEFQISPEEFEAWDLAFQEHGIAGLSTGLAKPQHALVQEEAAPWKSSAAPSSLPELCDWFTSQAQLCRQLAATYGREARLLLEKGDRRAGLARTDVAETIAVQARSYEHAAHLIANLGAIPG